MSIVGPYNQVVPPLSVILNFIDLNSGLPVNHPFILSLLDSGIIDPVKIWESDFDPFIRAQYCSNLKLYRTTYVCGKIVHSLPEISSVTLNEMLESFKMYKTDCAIISDDEYEDLVNSDRETFIEKMLDEFAESEGNEHLLDRVKEFLDDLEFEDDMDEFFGN